MTVNVVPAPSSGPIDKAGAWTTIADGVRPTTVRSDPQPAIGRAFCGRARKPDMAAIISPTVLRARMSVSQVCGAPAAGLDVHSSDVTPGAYAAPPSRAF
jgi:hypothetical protein